MLGAVWRGQRAAQTADTAEVGGGRVGRHELEPDGVAIPCLIQRVEDSREWEAATAGLVATGHIGQLNVTGSLARPRSPAFRSPPAKFRRTIRKPYRSP